MATWGRRGSTLAGAPNLQPSRCHFGNMSILASTP